MLLSLIITLTILAGQLIRIPVGFGGVTLLDTAIIILSFYALIKLKFQLKKPPHYIIIALVFLIIAVISLILTPLHLQFSEYLNSFFYIVRLAFYILFIQLVYSKAFPDFQKYINNTLIFSGVGLAMLGLLQFIILPDLGFLTKFGWDPHYFRTVSTFLDPNFAGAYFVLTLILLTQTSYLQGGIALTPRVFHILFLITFIALMTTFSRSSYLMFLISGLSLSFLQKSKKLMIKVIVLFIILLLGFQLYTQLVSKPRNIDREQSASFRLSTWQQGGQLFQSNPILGVGFNTYRYALKEYKLGNEQFLKSHGASSNDSSLLFVAATTGLIGLACYLLFLISLLKTGIRENFILAASISGLLIHSLFANSLFFPPIFLWVIIISLNPKK